MLSGLFSKRIDRGPGTRRAGWFLLGLALPAILTAAGIEPTAAQDAPPPPRVSDLKGEVRVAAAADLKFAFPELTEAFTRQHPGITLQPVFGSSGNHFSMLRNQAPFDVFLSADLAYPEALAKAGLGLDTNVFKYSIGQIVLWAPTNAPVDVAALGFKALVHPAVRKIAIANPRHAPYGRAAEAALKHAGIWRDVEGRLVLGDNIAQTLQFVESGAADVGIVALSLVRSPQLQGRGVWWEVPREHHPGLDQGGLILKQAKHPEAARAFRDFLLGAPGQKLLARYGFLPPGN